MEIELRKAHYPAQFFTKVFYVKLTSLFSHAQFFRNYEINNAKKAKKHGQEMTFSDEF